MTMNKTFKLSSLLLATLASAAHAGVGASWSTNGTECTDCTVSTAAGSLEVRSALPVLQLVFFAEQSNVIDGTLSDILHVYSGASPVGSIDLSNVGFDPLDLPPNSSGFGGPGGTWLVSNYSYLRSGYLTITSTDSFDRVRFVGPDSINVSSVPEPATMAMLLTGSGCLLLVMGRRRERQARRQAS